MKRFTIFACVMVIGAGTALAASLNVPFWRDTGDNLVGGGAGTPTVRFAGFIGIKNTTSVAKVISVEYDDGPNNVQGLTFLLGAGEGLAWRPFATDSREGGGSRVPNVPSNFNAAGSAVISWADTAAADPEVVGRYQEIGTSSMGFYLLPPAN